MKKLLAGGKLVVATHNKGKLKEFSAMLAPYFGEIVSAADLGLPEPEETGTTFEENALLKARHAAKAAGFTALADDSGLCVTALRGAPGVYSARYAETPKGRDFNFAMKRLNDEIGNNPDRSATFACMLALVAPDGKEELFEGQIDGTIIWPPRGSHGHGYDPVFVSAGNTYTFAEMSEGEKNAISHRAQAVSKLIAYLEKNP